MEGITEGISHYIRKEMALLATVEHDGLGISLKALTDTLLHREKRCSPNRSAHQWSFDIFAHGDVSCFLL